MLSVSVWQINNIIVGKHTRFYDKSVLFLLDLRSMREVLQPTYVDLCSHIQSFIDEKKRISKSVTDLFSLQFPFNRQYHFWWNQ